MAQTWAVDTLAAVDTGQWKDYQTRTFAVMGERMPGPSLTMEEALTRCAGAFLQGSISSARYGLPIPADSQAHLRSRPREAVFC